MSNDSTILRLNRVIIATSRSSIDAKQDLRHTNLRVFDHGV